MIRLWVKLLSIPRPWLYGGILVFATLGTIGVNPSPVELGMLLVFGVMGYVMRVAGYPIAPVIVGLILGPMAEQQLRRALSIAQGDPMTLVQSPIAAVILAIAAVALLAPPPIHATSDAEGTRQVAGDADSVADARSK